MESPRQIVFLTGGTGYMGSRLAPILLERGHEVRALTRIPSVAKLPPGCHPVFGSAVDGGYDSHVPKECTFVHLVGVSHPSPAKAEQFRTIDLAALRVSAAAAVKAQARHFVFVSVAHPAPAMKAYIAVREQCEQIIQESGLNATILRPWYVLGPGHRWPYMLLPFYWLMERIPATRPSALRLGLVTLSQVLIALVAAVENPVQGIRVVEVPGIRRDPTQPAQTHCRSTKALLFAFLENRGPSADSEYERFSATLLIQVETIFVDITPQL